MSKHFDYDSILNRTLDHMGHFNEERLPPDNGQKLRTTFETDNHRIEYLFNSYGYRSEEFKNQEILTLGCSNTVGYGLQIDKTWPYMLSKKMNIEYISLAKGGDGAQAQVIKAFTFFKEFYNPKYIFALFPLNRIEMPSVKNKFQKNSLDYDSSTFIKRDKIIQQCFLGIYDFDKISKAPHDPNRILPDEVAYFYNLMFIKMLEQYCDSNNIKFLWTTTDKFSSNESAQMFKEKIQSNSFFTDNSFLHTDLICHQEYKGEFTFDLAADNLPEKNQIGHWGWHKNLHMSETIYNLL